MLGSGPFRGSSFLPTNLQTPCMVPRKQTLQVVAVGSVSAKGVLVEQALYAATSADLIGTALGPDRPTHFAMPAAAEKYGNAGNPSRNQANGPEPAGASGFLRLFDFFHRNRDRSGGATLQHRRNRRRKQSPRKDVSPRPNRVLERDFPQMDPVVYGTC